MLENKWVTRVMHLLIVATHVTPLITCLIRGPSCRFCKVIPFNWQTHTNAAFLRDRAAGRSSLLIHPILSWLIIIIIIIMDLLNKMLGKSLLKNNIFLNVDLMAIYHGTIRKKKSPKNQIQVKGYTPEIDIDTKNGHTWKEIHFPNHDF